MDPDPFAHVALPRSCTEHLARLGARSITRFEPAKTRLLWAFDRDSSFVRVGTKGPSWSTVDPLGELREISPSIWSFRRLRWPQISHVHPRFGRLDIRPSNVSYDVRSASTRRLFHVFAYTERQHFLGLDLLDASEDPLVYASDHHPIELAPAGRLSEFLATLQPTVALEPSDPTAPREPLAHAAGRVSVWIDGTPNSAGEVPYDVGHRHLSTVPGGATDIAALLASGPFSASYFEHALGAARTLGIERGTTLCALFEYATDAPPGPLDKGVFLGTFRFDWAAGAVAAGAGEGPPQ